MRKALFKATIVGRDLVQKTGLIRIPESFRIRIYANGEAVITTRGRMPTTTEEIEYLHGWFVHRRPS